MAKDEIKECHEDALEKAKYFLGSYEDSTLNQWPVSKILMKGMNLKFKSCYYSSCIIVCLTRDSFKRWQGME